MAGKIHMGFRGVDDKVAVLLEYNDDALAVVRMSCHEVTVLPSRPLAESPA